MSEVTCSRLDWFMRVNQCAAGHARSSPLVLNLGVRRPLGIRKVLLYVPEVLSYVRKVLSYVHEVLSYVRKVLSGVSEVSNKCYKLLNLK